MNEYHIFEVSIDSIKHIYEELIIPNFLPEEIKPLPIINDLILKGHYKVLALEFDNNVVATAFLSYFTLDRALLLDYFVVDSKFRSKGIGSYFLNFIKEEFCRHIPLIIEIESLEIKADSNSHLEKERRKSFYTKSSAISTEILTSIWDCIYDLLYISNCSYSEASILELYDEIYRLMLPHNIYRLNCKIPIYINKM